MPIHWPTKAIRELDRATVFKWFDRPHAEVAARLQNELRREGLPMGWRDLQIAATAPHLGEPLLTSDGGFANVPGLDVVRF